MKIAPQQSDVRNTILYWLARRDYSQQEILNKLLAKKFSPEAFEPIVEQMLLEGLIKDSRFAESYLHSRRSRGIGPLRIKAELQTKGIRGEIIAEVLEIADNEWLEQARHVWQKRFRGKKAKDYAELAKQLRFLQQRGYTKEQIDNVLDKNRQLDELG